MLFITLMTKMPDTAEAKYKYGKNSPKLSRAPQGRRGAALRSGAEARASL